MASILNPYQGGTGTGNVPTTGQIPYSTAGSTYTPTSLLGLVDRLTSVTAIVGQTLIHTAGTASTRTTYSFVEVGVTGDYILDTSSSFVSDGFRHGQVITVSGSASNNGTYVIESVKANQIYISAAGDLVDEAAGASVTITAKTQKLTGDYGELIIDPNRALLLKYRSPDNNFNVGISIIDVLGNGASSNRVNGWTLKSYTYSGGVSLVSNPEFYWGHCFPMTAAGGIDLPSLIINSPASEICLVLNASGMAFNVGYDAATGLPRGSGRFYLSGGGGSVAFNSVNNDVFTFQQDAAAANAYMAFQMRALGTLNQTMIFQRDKRPHASTTAPFFRFLFGSVAGETFNGSTAHFMDFTWVSTVYMFIDQGFRFNHLDTSAAFYVKHEYTSSTALTADRTLTIDMVNAARTIKLTGNPTLADWFDQSVKTTASPTFAGLILGYVAKTGTYNIAATDHTIDCTSGTFTVTLPTAVGTSGAGKIYVIKNSGTGVITVATTSSQTIDGATTMILGVQYESLTLQSNNANWIVI